MAHEFRLGLDGAAGIPQEELLDAFLTTESTPLRREILPSLERATLQHGELAAKAARVVEICRTSNDDYLRTRVEVQLGKRSLFPPLPPRDS